MKHLLKLLDLTTEEIEEILNLADQLKYELKHGIEHHHLKGKTLGMIFAKASTRTRVSFETGMYQLGGYPMYLSANDMLIGIATAAPAGLTCLKEAAAGNPVASFNSFTNCQLLNASKKLIYPGLPFKTVIGNAEPSFIKIRDGF